MKRIKITYLDQWDELKPVAIEVPFHGWYELPSIFTMHSIEEKYVTSVNVVLNVPEENVIQH